MKVLKSWLLAAAVLIIGNTAFTQSNTKQNPDYASLTIRTIMPISLLDRNDAGSFGQFFRCAGSL